MASRMPSLSSQRKLLGKQAASNESHLERVASSLQLAMFLKRASKKHILIRRVVAGVAIFVLVSYNMGLLFVQADVVYMYPKSCLGGWSNPDRAQGEPETVSGTTDFSLGNAASLPEDSAAELYCGSFSGTVPAHVDPKSVTLTFVLKGLTEEETSPIVGTSFASSTLQILDATSTTDFELATTTATSTEVIEDATTTPGEVNEAPVESTSSSTETSSSSSETELRADAPIDSSVDSVSETSAPDAVPVAPESESTPAASPETQTPEASSPQSLLNIGNIVAQWFVPHVFAQESEDVQTEVSTTTEESLSGGDASSTLETSSSSATSSEESAEAVATSTQTDVFSVSYSLDGATWVEAGRISSDQLYQREFDLPLSATSTWSDIENIQVKVQTLQTLDGKRVVLLDGMFLSVEYEKQKEDTSAPSFADSDVISQISEEGKTVYLVKEATPITTVSAATTSEATTTVSSDEVATTTLSLWMKDESQSSWMLLASGKQLGENPQVQYQNGVVVWNNTDGVHYYDVKENQYLSSTDAQDTILGQNEENEVSEVPEVAHELTTKPLTERKLFRKIEIDEKAQHSCEPEVFRNDITGQATSSVVIFLNNESNYDSELEIGSLPKGINITFAGNGDYLYLPQKGEASVQLHVANEEGSQKGSFSIPIIYTLKKGEDSTIMCQFNLVNS